MFGSSLVEGQAGDISGGDMARCFCDSCQIACNRDAHFISNTNEIRRLDLHRLYNRRHKRFKQHSKRYGCQHRKRHYIGRIKHGGMSSDTMASDSMNMSAEDVAKAGSDNPDMTVRDAMKKAGNK